jgi:hypothetical protein
LAWCSNETHRTALVIVVVSGTIFLHSTEARAKDGLLLAGEQYPTIAGSIIITNHNIIARRMNE